MADKGTSNELAPVDQVTDAEAAAFKDALEDDDKHKKVPRYNKSSEGLRTSHADGQRGCQFAPSP